MTTKLFPAILCYWMLLMSASRSETSSEDTFSIECPEDIHEYVRLASQIPPIEWNDPIIVSALNRSFTRVEAGPRGPLFPLGVTYKGYFAVDSFGNTADCSFTVTIGTDECFNNPCSNGTCENHDVYGYICLCDEDFTGINCDTPVSNTFDMCEIIGCMENQVCYLNGLNPTAFVCEKI
ncbi:uncharacterized protein [Apostichopus japonicus]|uniref:uncharacterized protein n=1 Tax=Stichopus japonicus TaxID=307972 RepID=UPI003AB3B012